MLGGFFQKGIFKLFSNLNGRIDKDTHELIKKTEKAKLSDITLQKPIPIKDTSEHYTIEFPLSHLIPKNENGKLKGNRKKDIIKHFRKDIFDDAKVKDKTVLLSLGVNYKSPEQKIMEKGYDKIMEEIGMSAEELNKEKDRISLFRNFSLSEILSKDPTRRIQELNEYIGESLEENGKALAMWVGSFKMIMSVLPSISLQTLKDNGEKVKNFASSFFNYLKTAISTFKNDVWKPIWRQLIPMSRFEKLGGVGQFLANILCGYNDIKQKSDFEQAIDKVQGQQVDKFNKDNETNYNSLSEVKEDLIGDTLISRDGLPVNTNVTYNRTVDGKLRSYENLADYLQYEGFVLKNYDKQGKIGKIQKDKHGEPIIDRNYVLDAKGKTKTPKFKKPVKWNDLEFATEVPYMDLYKHIHNEIDLFELIRAIADSENDDRTISTVIKYILTQLQDRWVLPNDYPDLINDNVNVSRINKMAEQLYNLINPETLGGSDEKVNPNIFSKSKIKDKTNINNLNVVDVKNFIRHLGTQVDSYNNKAKEIGKLEISSVNTASTDAINDLKYLQDNLNAKEENRVTEQESTVGSANDNSKQPDSFEPVQVSLTPNDNTNYAKESGTAKKVAEEIVKEQQEFQNHNPIEETTVDTQVVINPQEQVKSDNGDVSFSVTTVGTIDNGTEMLSKGFWDKLKNSLSNYEKRNGL